MDAHQRERKIVLMKRAGHINTDIALEVGCTPKTVAEVLAAHHMSYQDLLEKRKRGIVSLRNAGWPVWEIAEQFGCSRTYVYAVLKERRGVVDE